MADPKLTKRNQDFIFQLQKHLNADSGFEASNVKQIISDTTEQLAEGQKSGKTARQLFGTPTEYSAKLANPQASKKSNSGTARRSPAGGDVNGPGIFDVDFLPTAIDTTLVVFTMFASLFALTSILGGVNANTIGVLSMILLSIYAGFLYSYFIRFAISDPRYPKTKRPPVIRTLMIVGMLILWLVGFLILTLVPRSINPLAPWYLYLVFAGIGYLGVRYYRPYAKLPGGLFTASTLVANSSARTRQAQSKVAPNKRRK